METKKCIVEDCDRQHRAKGYCAKHYYNQKGYGRGRGPGKPDYGVCVVDSCNEKAGPTGACRGHWHKVNRPDRSRGRTLLSKGLTEKEFQDMLDSQGGKCAICSATEPGGPKSQWAIDHDHSCCPGQKTCGDCNRALLCNRCNMVLGGVSDSPVLLQAMINYLVTPTPIDKPGYTPENLVTV